MALVTPARYVAGSAFLAIAIVWHACATREQFLLAMMSLSSSKLATAAMGNLALASAYAAYRGVAYAFLGRLREIEVERVRDRAGAAVVETCLALTVFREDVSAGFLAAFGALGFLKALHWLLSDRIDFSDATRRPPLWARVRLSLLGPLLACADALALSAALSRALSPSGSGAHMLLAFEAASALLLAIGAMARQALAAADRRLEGRWAGRSAAGFYVDLALDLARLAVHAAFFAAVFATYGVPLHLLRDLYWTTRAFFRRVADFLRYRRVAAGMERRFPDATEEDLARAGNVCVVCREPMELGGRNKVLACGHAFHTDCLRSWLERQQACPICRAPVHVPQDDADGADAAGAAAANGRAGGEAANGAAPNGAAGGAPPPAPLPRPQRRWPGWGGGRGRADDRARPVDAAAAPQGRARPMAAGGLDFGVHGAGAEGLHHVHRHGGGPHAARGLGAEGGAADAAGEGPVVRYQPRWYRPRQEGADGGSEGGEGGATERGRAGAQRAEQTERAERVAQDAGGAQPAPAAALEGSAASAEPSSGAPAASAAVAPRAPAPPTPPSLEEAVPWVLTIPGSRGRGSTTVPCLRLPIPASIDGVEIPRARRHVLAAAAAAVAGAAAHGALAPGGAPPPLPDMTGVDRAVRAAARALGEALRDQARRADAFANAYAGGGRRGGAAATGAGAGVVVDAATGGGAGVVVDAATGGGVGASLVAAPVGADPPAEPVASPAATASAAAPAAASTTTAPTAELPPSASPSLAPAPGTSSIHTATPSASSAPPPPSPLPSSSAPPPPSPLPSSSAPPGEEDPAARLRRLRLEALERAARERRAQGESEA